MKKRLPLLLAPLLAAVAQSAAAAPHQLPGDRPEYQRCIEQSSEAFGISPLPIKLLLDVEAGTIGRTSQNTNATVDMGPMQINSWWLPTLARMGIPRSDVLNNICVNIAVGTWIFVREWQRTPSDVATAIARYHSPTSRHQARYLGLVSNAIDRRLTRMETAHMVAPPTAGGSSGQSLLAAK